MALAAAALAIPAFVLAAIAWTMSGALLDESRWLAALDAGGTWERAPAAIGGQLVQWSERQPAGQARPLGPLDEGDVTALVTVLAPPATLRAEAAAVLRGILTRAGPDGRVHAVASLTALRQRLISADVAGAIAARMATWPACTASQEARLLTADPPRCRPVGVSVVVVAPVVAALFVAVASALPDSVDLAVPGPTPGAGMLVGTGVLEGVGLLIAARDGAPILGLVGALLLVLAALAQGPRPGRMLRAAGVPLVVAGILVGLAAWLTEAVAVPAAEALGPALRSAGAVPVLADLAVGGTRSFVSGLGDLLVTPAVVLGAVGALLLLLSLLFPGRRWPA